jgi:hypothetical protein
MFKVQIESDSPLGHLAGGVIPDVKKMIEERHGVNDFEDLWMITELEINENNPNFIEINTWVNNGKTEDRLYLTSVIVSVLELEALIAACKILLRAYDGQASP